MASKKLCCLPLIFIFLLNETQAVGEEGSVDLMSIKKCPLKNGKEGMKADPVLVEDGGEKYGNFELEMSFDIDEEFTYTMNIEKLEGDKYYPYTNMEDDICTTVDSFFKTIWDNMKMQSEPSISTDECKVPAGSYKLEHFQISADDYTVPGGLTGQFKIEARGFKQDGEEVCCFMIEAKVE